MTSATIRPALSRTLRKALMIALLSAVAPACSDAGLDTEDVGVNELAAASTYPGEVLADSPVGYWRLGESAGTTALDASGNGRSGTYVGGVTRGTAGALASDTDKAASFNGVDGLVSIPPSSAWSMGTANFTAEAWVNPNGDSGHGILSSFYYTGKGATLHQGWQVKLGGTSGVHSTGRYVWVRLWAMNSSQDVRFSSALPAGAYSHLAIVVDRTAGALRLYLNGALKQTVALTVAGSIDPPAGKILELGVKRVGAAQFLAGRLDEVAVYRTALSASRIKAHFDAAAAVAPPPSGNTTPVPVSFFGMHVLNAANTPTVSFGELGKAPSVGWCYIERTKGSFTWTYLDSRVQYAADHGHGFFYAHYCVPKWAAKDPSTCTCLNGTTTCTNYKCSSTVANIQDWKDWVAAVTARYRDRVPGIKVWEIWNEPYLNSADFTMTASEFAAMANAAVSVIRATDPSATIMGPSGHASEYDAFWAAGMTHDFDVVTTHGYPSLNNPTAESLVPARMDAIKNVMTKYNVAKPIWDSEGSWGTASLSAEQKSAFVARFFLLHWVNGLSRAYWYAWDEANWGNLMGNPDAATAYQQTYNWMVGSTFPTGCKASGSVYTCEVGRPNGYQGLVVWNTAGTSTYTPATTFIRVRDLAGASHMIDPGQAITIGIKPLLLQNQ
jgi:hypothetical protein